MDFKGASKKLLLVTLSLSILAGCSQNISNIPSVNLDQSLQNNSISTFAKKSKFDFDNITSFLSREEDELSKTPAQPINGQEIEKLPPVRGSKKLTYLTYEALDNNLYGDLNKIINTLEFIGSDNSLNLLAQTDSWKEGNSARYFITQESDFGTIKSPYVKHPEGENSSDPNVFANAVKWAYSTYPSKRNWLNVSTHGYGFAGINFDDNPEGSLDITTFAKALKSGLRGKKLDIVSFDACLMATVEVASELQDVSSVLVGSEDSTFYWGYGYYQTFSKLKKDSNMSPTQIARSLVMDVHNKGKSYQTLTISATNLSKVNKLEDAVNKLSSSLINALPKHKDDILRALRRAEPFAMAEDVPFRDLNRVVKLLKDNVNDPYVKEACDNINDVLYRKGLILFSRQNKAEKDQGRGLSIYVPVNGKVSNLYRKTRFAKETKWDDFLVKLNQGI